MKQDNLPGADTERAKVCKEQNWKLAESAAEKDSHMCKRTIPDWERVL